ncbi:carboxymuconolactone decarboxylase family protein [Mycobacterium kyogaense]|uniref:carboxymuconolactone decarboxylase family protein n=1 Tax=Mycobacterium kyogaense TaxID=2212479 RepID=UPI000DAB566E|nr:carboxymuconolactone decarboxylase family protein [Mycobacterium kyogaense]
MAKPTAYSSQVSVPLPDETELREALGEGYDSDRALNVVKMFAGTGDFLPALIGMVRAIFGADDIDAQHREVIILRAAAVLDVPYEWQANEQMARNAGLTAEEIERIAADGPVSGLRDEWLLLTTATDEMLTRATLTDATLQRLLDGFGPTTTRRYIATIAWFSLLSLFLNATRVPFEDTDKIGSRTSPLE